MRRPRTLPAVLLLAVLPLAGCSSDGAPDPAPSASSSESMTEEPSDPATPTPTPTPDESPTSTPSASPIDPDPTPRRLPTNREEALGLHLAVLGTSVADTAEEEAVVDAWMTFWQGVADTYYLYRPSPKFEQVARGAARRDILSYLATLKRDNERVMGWARENITEVTVDGSTARIVDCTKNFTFRVDAEGEPLTKPTRFYDTRGTLERSGDGWVVTSYTSRDLKVSCLP